VIHDVFLKSVGAEGHVDLNVVNTADTPWQNCTGPVFVKLKLYLFAIQAPVSPVFRPQNDKTRRGFPRRVLFVQFGLLAVGLVTRASDAT
jgi:hypothetical protein